jgi:hypothetical protein
VMAVIEGGSAVPESRITLTPINRLLKDSSYDAR